MLVVMNVKVPYYNKIFSNMDDKKMYIIEQEGFV